MKHMVIFEQASDGGWGAEVLDLPGCYSGGATLDDAREHVKEAIQAHVELAKEHPGTDGPAGRQVLEVVEA
jgi:predicted RNase H-like HicB family nuclease